MYKMDLALNNLQWLMCHKTKPNETKSNKVVVNVRALPTSLIVETISLYTYKWLMINRIIIIT